MIFRSELVTASQKRRLTNAFAPDSLLTFTRTQIYLRTFQTYNKLKNTLKIAKTAYDQSASPSMGIQVLLTEHAEIFG